MRRSEGRSTTALGRWACCLKIAIGLIVFACVGMHQVACAGAAGSTESTRWRPERVAFVGAAGELLQTPAGDTILSET